MKKKILAFLLSFATLSGGIVSAETESFEYEKFEALLNYAANLYIDENVSADNLMEEALRAVMAGNPELCNKLLKEGFESLDEYSEYYTKEEFELFNKNMNNIIYGIGVVIQEVDDYVTVMSCTEGAGADEAGVLSGDKILKVDGIDAKGLGVDKVQDLVVGENGTYVTIVFLRGDKEITKTIKRAEVKGNTVASGVFPENIGYIYIASFAEATDDEVVKVLDEFDAKGIKNIILDLRDNPGGYVDSAVNVASLFVPEGIIMSTVYRNEMNNEVVKSGLKNPKYKLAVLINENTASSAEILASAIGDSDVGVLVGNQTYGKGVIQEMFQMLDGSAFKITTGKYFTRNGTDINGNGIDPDEWIENGIRYIDVTKYTTFDYKTKPRIGDTSQNVRAAKERLQMLGYYDGTVSDNFDESLERAVYAFQEDADGLSPYGVLDISTQVRIENTFAKLDEVVDHQLYYAYEYLGGDPEKIK